MAEVLWSNGVLPEWCLFQTENWDSVHLINSSQGYKFSLRDISWKEVSIELSEEQFSKLNEALTKNSVEIERKFLVKQIPENLWQYSRTIIEQCYLIVWESNEVRIREKTKSDKKSYTLTIKSGNGAVRGEFETAITLEQYKILWTCRVGNNIEKIRFDIPHDGQTIEMDMYTGVLSGSAVAEVEFESEAEMNLFKKPDYLWTDVSDNKGLKNKNLALKGFPENLFSEALMSWVRETVKGLVI